MRKVTEDESKTLQIEMLDELHKTCVENGINYYLMYGTLLGSIRHEGYIPWDDDIDVTMSREDYEKFKTIFSHEYISVVDCYNTKDYYLPMPKMINKNTILKEDIDTEKSIGAYIDIFILDKVNPSTYSYRKILRKELFYRNLLALKIKPGSDKRKGIKKIVHTILNKLCRNMDMNRISRKMNDSAVWLSKDIADNAYFQIFTQAEAYNIVKVFNIEWFTEKQLSIFEGKKYIIPTGFKEILTRLYGDYMQLPPLNERISKHENSIFWIK